MGAVKQHYWGAECRVQGVAAENASFATGRVSFAKGRVNDILQAYRRRLAFPGRKEEGL